MILPEDALESPTPKTPLLQGHRRDVPLEPTPPPPYGDVIQDTRRDVPESSRMRFLKAPTLAMVVLALVSSFALWSFAANFSRLKIEVPTFPNPADGSIVACRDYDWSIPSSAQEQPSGITQESSAETRELPVPPYISFTSFDLAVDSPLLFLLSRGNLASGTVTLTIDNSLTGSQAKVDVYVMHHSLQARNRAKVCSLRRDGGEGIGFYTPILRWQQPSDHLQFTITVRFPYVQHHRLLLKEFQTNLPRYHHYVSTMSGVNFGLLNLSSTGMPLVSKGLLADQARLTTTDGVIGGSFNISRSLIINTSNALILADVLMQSEDDQQTTSLVMQTSNSNITSSISLWSKAGNGGRYNVDATTSDGHLELSFPASPPSSRVTLTGTTSNAPAQVSLHPAYEGSFSLQTSNELPSIEETDAKDPTGQNRSRAIEEHTVGRGKIEGYVGWGKPKHGDEGGSVTVKTSNAKNIFKI